MTTPRLVLVRHGETEWSLGGRHTSVTDVDLTPNGVRQAAALEHQLARLGIRPTVVLSSPRLRARRTAQLAGLEITAVWDSLAEWAYGEYEGITSAQIHTDRPGWSIFTDGAPGGESVEDAVARADEVIARAVRIAADAGDGDVVLIGHGHFSRLLAARWIGQPAAVGGTLIIDPASISVLGHYHADRALTMLNVPSAAPPERTRDALVSAVEDDVVAFSRRTRSGQATLAHQVSDDLTLAAYRLLVQVASEKECRITDLAATFEIGKPTMSRQVVSLEQLGLLVRRPDPLDRRGVLVSLSPAGTRLLVRARRVRHTWIEHLLSDFDESEATQFAALFHRFVTVPPAADRPI